MITSAQQAVDVQTSRRRKGLKGRSKAVRRWFKREHGRAIEAHGKLPEVKIPFGQGTIEVNLRDALDGDFDGCRSWTEAHLSTQAVGRILRKNQPVEIHTVIHHIIACPTVDEHVLSVLGKKNVHLEILNDK
jgi:hypothetical protein